MKTPCISDWLRCGPFLNSLYFFLIHLDTFYTNNISKKHKFFNVKNTFFFRLVNNVYFLKTLSTQLKWPIYSFPIIKKNSHTKNTRIKFISVKISLFIHNFNHRLVTIKSFINLTLFCIKTQMFFFSPLLTRSLSFFIFSQLTLMAYNIFSIL